MGVSNATALVGLQPERFPVDALVEQIRASLDTTGAVVVVAPPGSGKTTRLPLLLAGRAGRDRLIITEPRRVATRAAAARMAATLGERVGDTVGFRMRDETKVSAHTRIEVVTEGVFLRMLQNDPGLEGVSTVLFDEVHERSLDIDLSLTLAVNAKALLRTDLRLVAMSATLDTERFAAVLHAPVVSTANRTFPITVREHPVLIADLANGIVTELHNLTRSPSEGDPDPGDILVFLPGAGEIRSVERSLRRRPIGPDTVTRVLTGSSAPADVVLAMTPDAVGRRKIILATSVAQTSVTIPGVRTVVDSGLTRRSSFDPRTGLSRLVTERSTKATAGQRAGRAGREAPGLVVRLWSAADYDQSRDNDVPEISDADLADAVLQVAVWGVTDPSELSWIDEPPSEHWEAAIELLHLLGALDNDRKPTGLGRTLAGLPVPTRVGVLLLAAVDTGDDATLERAITLASELVGGAATPQRLRRLVVGRLRSAPAGDELEIIGATSLQKAGETRARPRRERSTGQLSALAFPERIAGRVGDDSGRYQLVTGVVATMADDDPLRGTPVIVALDIDGDRRAGRIFRAIAVTAAEILDLEMATTEVRASRRLPSGRIETIHETRLGAAVLTSRPTAPTGDEVAAAVIADLDLAVLLSSGAVAALRARLEFLRALEAEESRTAAGTTVWPDWSIEKLVRSAGDWLGPELHGRQAKDPMRGVSIETLLLNQLSPSDRRRLDAEAPVQVVIPSGRSVTVEYLDSGGPTIEAKLQEFFGASAGPKIAGGRIPVRMVLLSPAGRPAAVTSDLSGFWRNGYPVVRSELRGWYPRHPWPDDPAAAVATARSQSRSR